MTRRAAAGLLAAVALLAACGDDGGDELDIEAFAGEYTVTMSVGDARSAEAADAALLPARGSSFTEQWVLECSATSCSLRRPEGGVALGDLDRLELAPPPAAAQDRSGAIAGTAEGVRPEPAVAEPDPCDGTPAERWTVRVEVSVDDGVLFGSVIRTPDALSASVDEAQCYGVDLTLGLAGVRR